MKNSSVRNGKNYGGMSLIEILIVITIFAVLGVIVTQSIILSLQGSKKSESSVIVRENLDYAAGVIERQLRNANSIPICSGSGAERLDYIDQYGKAAYFSCLTDGEGGYVASGSATFVARLTSPSVSVACSGGVLTCNVPTVANPPSVDVVLIGSPKGFSGKESSTITKTLRIYLRNY